MKNNYNGKFSQTRNMKDNYFLKTSVSPKGALYSGMDLMVI